MVKLNFGNKIRYKYVLQSIYFLHYDHFERLKVKRKIYAVWSDASETVENSTSHKNQ